MLQCLIKIAALYNQTYFAIFLMSNINMQVNIIDTRKIPTTGIPQKIKQFLTIERRSPYTLPSSSYFPKGKIFRLVRLVYKCSSNPVSNRTQTRMQLSKLTHSQTDALNLYFLANSQKRSTIDFGVKNSFFDLVFWRSHFFIRTLKKMLKNPEKLIDMPSKLSLLTTNDDDWSN